MTDPIDKDALIRRLERRNEFLQRRLDRLAEDNDRLMLELQARMQSSVEEARRKSWGGNGRY
jgi:chaperonin cofactor prefoldin